MIYWEQGGYLGILNTITALCESKQNSVDGSGEQQLWQQDTDWDVDRPHWPLALPAVAPGLSPTDTLGHFPCASTHRYTLFPVSVYRHMLIPINLLLVGEGWREGPGGLVLDWEAAEGG